MVITYHGENYFKISSGNYTILVDPVNQRSYKGAQVILFTERAEGGEPREAGQAFLVDHAGEFEIGGVAVTGWTAEGSGKGSKTIYRVSFEDLTVGILGKIEREPGQEFTERLENADIVIAPIGGKPYASVAGIAKFLRQIEPGLIIPSLYASDKNLKEFFKEFGEEAAACDEKLVIKKKDIVAKAMQVRCLKSE